jgi:hypothetical protein
MAADPLPDGSQIPTQTALGADIAATTPPLRQWADRSVSAAAGGRHHRRGTLVGLLSPEIPKPQQERTTGENARRAPRDTGAV